METGIRQAKTTFKDLPKVMDKPAAHGGLTCDIIYNSEHHKMIVQFRDQTTNQILIWATIDNPENFCNVVDAFRGQRG